MEQARAVKLMLAEQVAEGRGLFGWVCGRPRRMPLVGLYGSREVPALFSLQALDLPVEKRIAAGAPGFRA